MMSAELVLAATFDGRGLVLLLQDFLTAHRSQLIERCRASGACRQARHGTEWEYGIPSFLDQLVSTLIVERNARSSADAHGASEIRAEEAEMIARAWQHGHELLGAGWAVDQVVHSYGDVCQAITGLAIEQELMISTDEFRTLNRCLDNAMAAAVTSYVADRDAGMSRAPTPLNVQRGFLAQELRSVVHTATIAYAAIKKGNAGVSGATSALLDRCLRSLRSLLDRSLIEVHVSTGMPRLEFIGLAEVIDEALISAALDAHAKGCGFSSAPVDPEVAVFVDQDLLLLALGNVLQNACKFTEPGCAVSLHAQSIAGRVLIEVADHCGGLTPGAEETMIVPYAELGNNVSGLGLGLSIAQRCVELNRGLLSVRNVPGWGCIFTIDLPRHSMPSASPRAVQ